MWSPYSALYNIVAMVPSAVGAVDLYCRGAKGFMPSKFWQVPRSATTFDTQNTYLCLECLNLNDMQFVSVCNQLLYTEKKFGPQRGVCYISERLSVCVFVRFSARHTRQSCLNGLSYRNMLCTLQLASWLIYAKPLRYPFRAFIEYVGAFCFKMLPSVKFAEDKVLTFLILR